MTADADGIMPPLTPDDEAAPESDAPAAPERVEAKKGFPLWAKITIGLIVIGIAAIVARTALKADGKPATASTTAAATTKKTDADPAPVKPAETSTEPGLPAWYMKEVTPWATEFTATVNNHDALLNGANGSEGLIKKFEAVKAENDALKGELATMKSRLDALEGRIPSPATGQ